jgi:hypothetical protein
MEDTVTEPDCDDVVKLLVIYYQPQQGIKSNHLRCSDHCDLYSSVQFNFVQFFYMVLLSSVFILFSIIFRV